MKPLLLCILDGVGVKDGKKGNALNIAKTPVLDELFAKYPNSQLNASEVYVGLPNGQMGNSEVGHINIGTGRKVKQAIDIINEEIRNNSLKNNEELNKIIRHVQNNNSSLHICGLLSDGGIHSHINHLFSLIDILKDKKIKVYYHVFTDGRDTKPKESLKYIKMLEEKIKETNLGQIATISGRYYAMDRDNRWDRVKKTYNEMTEITIEYDFNDRIKLSYEEGITDEFIVPFTVYNKPIEDNDGILVFNFRPDRLRELFTALSNKEFSEFETKKYENIYMVTMFPVDKNVLCKNLFKHPKVDNYLGKVFERENLRQLRIAETEKYAHVTYFFDGENKDKLRNCDQILVPSKKVATYDLVPEMSANEITNKLLDIIEKYDIIILNFANGDMVGHTGNFDATVKALEILDECIGKIYNKITELNGTMIITADHGNCDKMLDEEGNVITSHSLSKVPFLITNINVELKDGKLSDIAPTILKLLNIEIPKEMTGDILIK